MYFSNYDYSVDFDKCSETLFNYDNCNNYLRNRVLYLEECFLTQVSSDKNNVFYINTFYLNSDVIIELGGNGSKDNPYVIG